MREYNAKHLKSLDIDVTREDIRDFEAVMRATEGCDYIIHTATQPAMTLSADEPELNFKE